MGLIWGGGLPLLSRLGVWRSVVGSHCRVQVFLNAEHRRKNTGRTISKQRARKNFLMPSMTRLYYLPIQVRLMGYLRGLINPLNKYSKF